MPPTRPKLVLDDDQRFALMKFRRSVQDVLQPHHDDHFLLRWLHARSWNAEGAEKMLRDSLKWRKEWELDGALKSWKPPEPVVLYHPSGHCGFDKEGNPIIILPFSGLDVIGMLHAVPKKDLIRATLQILESYLDIAAKAGTHQVVAILDMEDFNLRQYAWRPAAEVTIQLIKMYEANYPEVLKACYIVNAPRVFAIAFNVVKNFLNEYTLGKIEIYKSDPKKWKKVLLDNIDPDNLPQHYGGNLCDPDGNPKYTTKIKQGGKVPKKYYTKNLQSNPDDESKDYTYTVVKKGDKLSIDFIVAEPGCYLRWDFKTEAHDIKFGITLKDEDNKTTPAIKHHRVAAYQTDETGVLACQSPATYTVTFDNSYSLLRSKKLHYNVRITPPLDKLDLLPAEDMKEISLKHESLGLNGNAVISA